MTCSVVGGWFNCCFFLSLEDKLLRLFGGDQILNVMQNIGFDDSTPIQSPILNKSAQTFSKSL